MEEDNTYIGKFSHNSEITGQKIDTFSSKSSKQDEKDKTSDKRKITKDNLDTEKNLKPQTFLQTLKVWISSYDMSEKWWVMLMLV